MMFEELVGGAGFVGRQEKDKVDGVPSERTLSQSFRYQSRPVDGSPGSGGIAEDAGTGSGKFHGEMDPAEKVEAGLRHTEYVRM